jgi:hypothetical protein
VLDEQRTWITSIAVYDADRRARRLDQIWWRASQMCCRHTTKAAVKATKHKPGQQHGNVKANGYSHAMRHHQNSA